MATNLPSDVVSTLLAAVVYHDATLNEIAAAFPDPPVRSTAKDWADALIAEGLVGIDDRAKPFRYFATTAGGAYYREHCVVIAGASTGPAAPPPSPAATGAAAARANERSPSPPAAGADPAGTDVPPSTGSSVPALGSGVNARVNAPLGGGPAASVPNQPVNDAPSLGTDGAKPAGDHVGDDAKTAGDHAGDPVDEPPPPEPSPQPSSEPSPAIAGASGAPTGAAVDDLKPLFDGVVHPIVAGVLPRASALALLQTWPSPALADPAQRRAFVQYGMDRLEHLRLGECIGLGLQPGQFELWRRQYFGESSSPTSGPATSASAPRPAAADAREPNTEPAGLAHSAARNPRSESAPAGGPKSPGSAHGGGADHAPATSGAELIAGVLTPLLSAVLPATTPVSMPPASAGMPAMPRRAAPNLAPNPVLSAALTRLIDALARRPGGANAAVAGVLIAAVSSLLYGFVRAITGSPTLGLTLAGCFFVGWLLWPWLRAATARAGEWRPEAGQTSGATAGTPPPVSHSAFRVSRFWFATALALVGLLAGVLWYRQAHLRPSDAAIRDYLVTSAAPLPVRIANLAPTCGPLTGTSCPVTYQAVFETTAPLYRRIDATEYLRTHAPVEFPAIAAAAALLAGSDGAQLRAALAAAAGSSPQGPQTGNQGPGSSPLSSPLLVTTATPAGTSVVTSGVLLAWKRDAGWGFSPQQGGLDHSRFIGEPKPPEAVAVDLPADTTRLTAWLSDQVAYAAKVQAAATALAAQRERARQQQAAAFAQLLRPGTLFAGTITDPMRGTSQRIILELTTAPGEALAALLRNDGGWSDARPFTGSWTLNAAGDAAVVTLRTARSNAINSAGPLLQDRLDWALTLTVSADGSTSARTDGAATPLRRIDPAGADAVKADVLQPLGPAIAATAPGLVYRGTATARLGGTVEPLLLRFLPANGSPTTPPAAASTPAAAAPNLEAMEIRATLESATTAAQVRQFRGTLVSNTYRVGDSPIRLQSADAARVATANPRSVLGLNTANDSLAPALRADGVRLTGQDAWFTYEFTPAPAAGAPGADGWPPAAGDTTPESAAGGAPGSTLLTPPLLASAVALEPGIAYARIAGRWVPLPHNNGHEVKKLVQVLSGWLNKITPGGAKPAGEDVKSSDAIIGELVFDGTDPVPVLPGADVLIVYVGGITPRSQKEVAAYPTLLLEPPVELAPMRRLDGGARYTLLSELVPGVKYFGVRRVGVVIEQPQPTVTVFRPRAALTPGPYALNCSGQTFEFQVQ